MSGAKKRMANAASGGQASTGQAAAAPADRYLTGYDTLLVTGDISERLFSDVVETVSLSADSGAKQAKVVVCLTTYGGQANAAYRIGRYLQHTYDEVVAFVPSLCKSAGTLVVTAAHSLVIGEFGEIGPLDVQLSQRDEIVGYRSGLVTRSAIDDLGKQTFQLFETFVIGITQRSRGAVSFRLASEIAARAAAECMSSIYEKVSPDTLGQELRDLNVATAYAQRLAESGGNLKARAIHALVHEYPSHDFVIDLDEASKLFNRVASPTPSLHLLQEAYLDDMLNPQSGRSVVKMLAMPPQGGGRTSAKQSPTNGSTDAAAQVGTTPGDGKAGPGEAERGTP